MKRIASVLLVLVLLVSAVTLSVSATGSCGTAATDLIDSNVSADNVFRRTARSWSYLHLLADGNMMTVIYLERAQRVEISYYSSDFKILKTLNVTPELSDWGGFYATDDAYFLITGQENMEESPDVEVMRVTKYTTAWERVGHTSLYDVDVVNPFAFGQVRCATDGNVLAVHTAREMYYSAGSNHQANFSFSINIDTMEFLGYRTGKYTSTGYVSHSFDQYIYYDGEKFVTVDHGDGSPRAVVLNEHYPASFKVANKIDSQKSAYFLEMPGEAGDNDTGISTGGFAVSPTSYILVGNSRLDDLDDPTLRSRPYNVFVSVIDRETYEVTRYELTNITTGTTTDSFGFASGNQAYTPYIVKISDSQFMVLWKVTGIDTVYYQKLNGSGEPVGDVYSMPGTLSYVEPQVIDGKVTWYSYQHNEMKFYTISTSNWKNTGVKTVNNAHTYYAKNDAQDHWYWCSDCGYTTPKEAHSDSVYTVFTENGTRDTLCWDCGYVFESDPIYVTVVEGVSSSGGVKLQLGVKTGSGLTLTSEDLTFERTSTSYVQENGKNYASKVTYKFTNTGDKKGSFTRTFYRLPNVAKVADIATQAYTGKAITPAVQVKVSGTVLKNGTDYTLSYKDNTKAGTATVIITGKGSYFGTIEKTFTIAENIADAKVTGITDKTYTGAALPQSPKVVLNGKTLQNGTDYTLSYKNNTSVGTATVTITGKGAYAGSVDKTFKITAISAEDCKASLSATSYTYDGREKTPSVTVKDAAGKTLKENTDYTVTYAKGRKNVGTYKVTVKMKGNYSGTKTLTFKIKTGSVSSCKISLSATSYAYNGKTRTPSVTVKDAAGNTLKKDTDYTVTYAKGRKKVGTYKVTVKMKGNLTGTKVLTFKIKPASVSTCKIKLSATSYTYNGKVKTPSVTVKNAAGKTLKKGTDYTVTYAKGRKNVGTYKVTVKMKGSYTGTKTLTFKITPKAASIKKLTAKAKAFTVSLNRVTTQSTGYEVQYSTSKTFKKATTKTVKSSKTASLTVKKLKTKTKYFVRVRTYKTVNGSKVYSKWSAVKTVKTK